MRTNKAWARRGENEHPRTDMSRALSRTPVDPDGGAVKVSHSRGPFVRHLLALFRRWPLRKGQWWV